jgi:hypothetical protein
MSQLNTPSSSPTAVGRKSERKLKSKRLSPSPDNVTKREAGFMVPLLLQSTRPIYNALCDKSLRSHYERKPVLKALCDAALIDKDRHVFDLDHNIFKLRIIDQEFAFHEREQERLAANERRRRLLIADARAAKRSHMAQVRRVKAYRELHIKQQLSRSATIPENLCPGDQQDTTAPTSDQSS